MVIISITMKLMFFERIDTRMLFFSVGSLEERNIEIRMTKSMRNIQISYRIRFVIQFPWDKT